MDLYDFTLYMGIATYLLLLLTFLIGFRVIKASIKTHRVFAIITLIFASTHAWIFIYMNFLA